MAGEDMLLDVRNMTKKFPLARIGIFEKIKYVMINGRIYDSMTMNETISREKMRPKLWFEMDKGVAFSLPYKTAETWTFTVPNCD